MSRGFFSGFLISTGLLALVGSTAVATFRGVAPLDVLLLGLTGPAAWLRISLEPTGSISLAPVVVLVSFFLGTAYAPFLVATVGAVVGVLLSREPPMEGLQSIGEEATPVALSVAVAAIVSVSVLNASLSSMVGSALAACAYVVGRVLIATLRARYVDDVEVKSFLSAAGKSMAANLAFFFLVALGLAISAQRLGSSGHLTLALVIVALIEAYHPYKLLSDQRNALFASLTMIAHAVDLKDAYTGRHAREASEIAVRIARRLRLPEPEVRKIRIAGILHDIGKIGVSGQIIRKPTALSLEEMNVMRQHPTIGAEIMQPVELLAGAADIVRHHHEHFDGSGYPDGLKGEQIPVGSRIVLAADAFNAITTNRPYRRARSKEEALKIIRDGSGKQFDPAVVKAIEAIAHLL